MFAGDQNPGGVSRVSETTGHPGMGVHVPMLSWRNAVDKPTVHFLKIGIPPQIVSLCAIETLGKNYDRRLEEIDTIALPSWLYAVCLSSNFLLHYLGSKNSTSIIN